MPRADGHEIIDNGHRGVNRPARTRNRNRNRNQTIRLCNTIPHAAMIDLRSDTVTRPTPAMREAMQAAELGDDVLGDDPTVLALERTVADRAGKEAALFVPSGTMSNQLAIRAQTTPGDEVLLHRRSHIFHWESGGPAALSGVHCRTLDSADGTLPQDALDESFHDDRDPHYAPTRLVCLENTHNGCGGLVVPLDHMRAVCTWAAERGLRRHLDGARLWNALVATGTTLDEAAAPFDTVSLCFSKGLGAPVGSILVGDAETIRRARRFRKMFGGGMRQAGLLAAAALHALEHHVDRLADDHARARRFVEHVATLPGIVVDPGRPFTNLAYFAVTPDHPLQQRGDSAVIEALATHGIRLLGQRGIYRAAFHLDVDDHGLARTLDAFDAVFGNPA